MNEEREEFHSNDFGYLCKINGKTKKEYEEVFNVVGEIQHMKDLGWNKYQWKHVTEHECKPNIEVGQFIISKQCFAEFFGINYNGYIRGDGTTVREAILSCLNKAQTFAACTKHEYQSIPKYTNGLIRCSKCGFWGYTSLIKTLHQQIEYLTIQLEIEKEFNIKNERRIKEEGITEQEHFSNTLKDLSIKLKANKEIENES